MSEPPLPMPFLRARKAVELSLNESVLWSGRPDPEVIFTSADAFLIPQTIVQSLVVLFVLIAISHEPSTGTDSFPGVGRVFVGFAVVSISYSMVGRFFVKRWINRRTTYTLTTRRAIVSAPLGRSREAGLSSQALKVRTSRNGRHVSVTFDKRRSAWGPVNLGNTGLDLLNTWRLSTTFYDVANPADLLQALDRIPQSSFVRQPKPSADNFFGADMSVGVRGPGPATRIPVIEHQATEVGWRQETGLLRLSDDGTQIEVWLGRTCVGHLADPSFEQLETIGTVEGLVQTTLLRRGEILWADVPVSRGAQT